MPVRICAESECSVLFLFGWPTSGRWGLRFELEFLSPDRSLDHQSLFGQREDSDSVLVFRGLRCALCGRHGTYFRAHLEFAALEVLESGRRFEEDDLSERLSAGLGTDARLRH